MLEPKKPGEVDPTDPGAQQTGTTDKTQQNQQSSTDQQTGTDGGTKDPTQQ